MTQPAPTPASIPCSFNPEEFLTDDFPLPEAHKWHVPTKDEGPDGKGVEITVTIPKSLNYMIGHIIESGLTPNRHRSSMIRVAINEFVHRLMDTLKEGDLPATFTRELDTTIAIAEQEDVRKRVLDAIDGELVRRDAYLSRPGGADLWANRLARVVAPILVDVTDSDNPWRRDFARALYAAAIETEEGKVVRSYLPETVLSRLLAIAEGRSRKRRKGNNDATNENKADRPG